MKFQQIVAKAERTAHLVYGYKAPNGKIYKAPKPVKNTESGSAELQRIRTAERKERAARMAELVHAGGIDKCEELGVDIAQLIEPAKHMTLADSGMPVMVSLLKALEE